MRGGIEAVEDVLQAGGLRVRRPGADKPAVPYVTLWPLLDVYDGTTGCPWNQVDENMQGTCVASDDVGAMWMQDKVYELLTAATSLTVEPIPSGPLVEDTDTAEPSLFYTYPRWRLRSWVADYAGA